MPTRSSRPRIPAVVVTNLSIRTFEVLPADMENRLGIDKHVRAKRIGRRALVLCTTDSEPEISNRVDEAITSFITVLAAPLESRDDGNTVDGDAWSASCSTILL